jgi:hypothetical protein
MLTQVRARERIPGPTSFVRGAPGAVESSPRVSEPPMRVIGYSRCGALARGALAHSRSSFEAVRIHGQDEFTNGRRRFQTAAHASRFVRPLTERQPLTFTR